MTLRGWLIMLGIVCTALAVALIVYRENSRFHGKSAKVIEVLDCGNMLLTTADEKITMHVRLDWLTCPSMLQPFGVEARKFTHDRVMGKDVLYQIHSASKDFVGFEGRRIVYVDIGLPDASLLSEELIKAGLATSKDPDLQVLENQAKAARRGMWGAVSR